MNKKNRLFIQIMCWILAGLMVASAASLLITLIFA